MENLSSNNGITQFFNVENSKNPELGNQIRQEIDVLANKFIELDDHERSIKRDKKSIILELADKFERLYEIGELPIPVPRIGAYIYRYLQRKGFDVSDRYIRDVLKENAPQYLSNTYEKENSSDIDIKVYQDEVMSAISKLKNIRYELLTNSQIQELISSKHESLDLDYEYADKNKITIEPTGQADEPHYDSSELDPFKDIITTDKPEPRPSNLAEATIYAADGMADCSKTMRANGEMMKDYPPDEGDVLEIQGTARMTAIGDFYYNLSKALKNGTDRKYRRSFLQWVKIAQDEADWGKHASSSKNPYQAKFKDKDGNWKQETRKLTREQIGDVSPKVRDFAKFFKQTFPAFLDFMDWSQRFLHPYTNGESVKLSEKLSDRSLR